MPLGGLWKVPFTKMYTFGSYEHYYPVQTVGQPPNVFFTFKRDEHWTTNREKRLRVRAGDLNGNMLWMNHSPEKMAVKTSQKDTVFLVPVHTFLNKKELSFLN